MTQEEITSWEIENQSSIARWEIEYGDAYDVITFFLYSKERVQFKRDKQ